MSDENRPDPDELLSRITEEESEAEDQSRGTLKIFFGACAGVGKTYAMLSAGKTALNEGRNVLVGLVETHGRSETGKLLEGLPLLPSKEVNYRGTTIKEFDLDKALELKPELILLDELAHTNAPSSRHPKRWQDVEELLGSGIDVYTTVNVQHLESLNDVVARITGVWVKETVPDSVFDKADEISLVDIPSEELLKRLREGKVYIAPGAKQRAAQNFFKKSNLIALRELALRRTAERVDALMDDYKLRGRTQAWSGAEKILACIGPDQLSAKLVRTAKRMSSGLKAPWTVVYIENDRHFRLTKSGQETVEHTMRLAERMGAKTETVQGNNAADALMAYARENGITKIVVGKRQKSRWKEVAYGTLADALIRRSGDIDIYVVTGEAENKPALHSFWHVTSTWQYYSMSFAMALVCTFMLWPLRRIAEPASLVMLYLIGVVAVALRCGRGPALMATLLSALCYNFFFIAPIYELKITDEQHIITFLAILGTGFIISSQTTRLRMQAISSSKREKNTNVLYVMTRELTANRGKVTLAQIAGQHISGVLDAEVFIWIPDDKGELQTVVSEGESEHEFDPVREENVARWAFTHKQNAGLGTDTLPSAKALYMPLIISSDVLGVLGVMPRDERVTMFANEKVDLLETFASITASALERASSAEIMEQTVVEAESEKLRNILLSSVSHDLRTPLATITSAASTMLMEGQNISEEYRTELLRTLHEEAARLARMVTSLLDVTSLESGSVRLNKELYFIEELIGSALMRVEGKLARHQVETRIEHGLPLVRMDGLLIEQVLINLLENAAEYTPTGTSIVISAKLARPDLHITVRDSGPGLQAGDEERIFDRTNTKDLAANEKHTIGFGLAICRGIISAHNGRIWAENVPEGGAIFTFTLPIRAVEEDA